MDKIGNANAKGEYYLTDIVEIASAGRAEGHGDAKEPESVLGINNRAELAEAEAHLAATPPPRNDALWRLADCSRNGLFLATTPKSARKR